MNAATPSVVAAPEANRVTRQDEPAAPRIAPDPDQVSGKAGDSLDQQTPNAIEKVKKVLEGRNKIMLSIAFERAEQISIEGNYLLLSYAPSNRHDKAEVENARQLIEEACYEAIGTRLTLSASLTGAPSPAKQAQPSEQAQAARTEEPAPENHPAVRAVVERFDGEIIGVEGPER